MLNWANRFSIFCLLDNNGYEHELPAFECMLAAGCKRSLQLPAGHAVLQQLRDLPEHSLQLRHSRLLHSARELQRRA